MMEQTEAPFYACPKCGRSELAISAVQYITAYIDGNGDMYDDRGGDTEWEDDSPCRCTDCRFEGTVKDFMA